MNLNEHAQAVLKGYELCMVKADGDFFFWKDKPDATEEMPLRN